MQGHFTVIITLRRVVMASGGGWVEESLVPAYPGCPGKVAVERVLSFI